MNDVVSSFQNAFVKGRLISDNIILKGELINNIKNKKIGKGILGALKIDMDKAYDRISWSFIKVILDYMGVNQHWIKLIMECICTVSYQFLVNGSPSKTIKPSRGLRQGDPLSLYIFILYQNVLSQLVIES